jgi:IS5 family transposase
MLARYTTSDPEHGWLIRAHAVEKAHSAVQNARAARTVAGNAANATDCEQLLDMLGLDARDGKRH